MAFQLSPGVSTSEVDLTTVVPSVQSSIGGFAGKFNWGPVNEVITITDEVRLVQFFGKPDNDNYEYWFSAANYLAYSNNLKVVRAANTQSTFNATANGTGILIPNKDSYLANYGDNENNSTTYGPVAARWAGSLGNSLRISMCPSTQAFSSNLTSTDSMRANAFNYLVDNTSIININGTPNAAANLIAGDLISIDGGSSYNRVTSVNANTISVSTALTANIVAGTAIIRKWQYADNFGIAPSTSIFASALGGSGDEMHIIVVDEDGGFSSQVANTIIEKYSFVSKASDARNNDGTTNYYKNLINDTSNYIWWMNHQPGATNWGNTAANRAFTTINVPFSASLSAGSTGNVSTANVLTSYAKFQNSDEIDVSLIVSGPGDATVATSLISLAEARKDAMVFLSPTRASVINNSPNEKTDIVTYRNGLTSSSYAVIDSGYKYQYDKYNDVYRYVPLNGDIAGTCARTDAERDAWFSPGGLNRGLIRNSIKLAYNPSKADRDELYIRGVNPVVTFQGEGTVLFGDKTMLNRPSVFDRINVRRLFIILEKSIAKAARFSLFEFNDEFTRSQFVNLVEPFLRTVQGRRGITDFRVVCDTSNNTPDVIDRNEFVGDIYIKPNRSINFIQLNFVAVQSGVSFEEIIGNF
jgi:hypothetical protein